MTVTPEQVRDAAVAATMTEFIHSPGWACFSTELHGMILASIESLINTPDPRTAGRIEGLRDALSLPDHLRRKLRNQ